MSWFSDLHYLDRMRKLEKKRDEKEHEESILRINVDELSRKILFKYRNEKEFKGRISIDEILNDDSPNIVNIKMELLLENEKLKKMLRRNF